MLFNAALGGAVRLAAGLSAVLVVDKAGSFTDCYCVFFGGSGAVSNYTVSNYNTIDNF